MAGLVVLVAGGEDVVVDAGEDAAGAEDVVSVSVSFGVHTVLPNRSLHWWLTLPDGTILRNSTS